MIYTYAAVMQPEDAGYCVRVPDLPGCVTSGRDLADAIDMVTDAASVWLCASEDMDNPTIPPTDPRDIEHEPNEIVTLIRVDTKAYRAATDNIAVKKTVSIPQSLAIAAEKKGLSLSQVLQEALRERVNQ